MKVKLLTTAVCATLAMSAWTGNAHAGSGGALDLSLPAAGAARGTLAQGQSPQDQQESSSSQDQEEQQKKKATELQQMTVTGSLIPRAQIETSTPTVQITAEDIKAQGFQSVYEALKSSPFATGGVQGAQDGASFTQGAETLSLFGLDPNFTLTLINGHPMAEYPLLYNGSSNFVDLSSIPMSMVDHIDIVPGNQSAIYGSSAIAGVINIVLKDHAEGFNVNVRVGGYSEGGGANQRISFTGGHQFGNLNVVYGMQYNHNDPIWAYQRDWTKSRESRPDGQNNGRTSLDRLIYGYDLTKDNPSLEFFGPLGEHACDGISNLWNGTMRYNDADARGPACGTEIGVGYATLKNKQQDTAGYLHMSLPLGENAQAYGDFLYNHQKVQYGVGANYTWWGTGADYGYLIDDRTGQLFLTQWGFSPEEVGGYDSVADTLNVDTLSSTLGVRGNVGDSDWAYDAYYSRSQQWLKSEDRQRIASKIDAFFQDRFLGPQYGTLIGYPVYRPNWDNFYTAITPQDYRSFTEVLESRNQSWVQNLNLQVTNVDLFSLPGGSAGLAALVQVGNQHWSNHPNAKLLAGDVWGTTATSGFGKRENYAAAVEMNLPIWKWLTVDGSVRYDDYKFAGRSDAKATYKLGVEIRPIDTLLFRANYATAFRAPDMSRIFLGPSGAYSFVPDYYGCDQNQPGDPYADCTFVADGVQSFVNNTANPDLKDIEAKSWGAGIVWSPTNDFNARIDYVDIKVDKEVNDMSVTALMRNEADCQNGVLDPNSPTCVDAFNRVQRGGPRNLVEEITLSPINISKERTQAITAGANYRWDIGKAGSLTFGLQYNNVLKHEKQQYAGDPYEDLLNDPRYKDEYKSILAGDVTWGVGNWSTTLYGRRYGHWPNYMASYVNPYSYDTEGAKKNPSWTLYNLRVKYDLPSNASIAVTANNVFNKMPPRDTTFTSWPYYETHAYNVYGRAIFVEFDMNFGN